MGKLWWSQANIRGGVSPVRWRLPPTGNQEHQVQIVELSLLATRLAFVVGPQLPATKSLWNFSLPASVSQGPVPDVPLFLRGGEFQMQRLTCPVENTKAVLVEIQFGYICTLEQQFCLLSSQPGSRVF